MLKSLIFALSLVAVLSSPAYAWKIKGLGHYQFEKYNNNVFVMHGPLGEPSPENQGFMNNPGFIESENGLILIDPGSTYQVGKQVLKEIEKVSTKPILAVFNTHIHGDHWLGNQAVKEKYSNVKIYAHPAMIEQAKGEAGPEWLDRMSRMTNGLSDDTKVVVPEFSVDDSEVIAVDGQHFRIHAIVPAHTNTDIMIEHVESKTLFLGDNGFIGRIGRFDSSASMIGNIKALEHAADLDMILYIPGHGQSGNSDVAIKPYLDYLKQVQTAVQKGFNEELQDFEIKQQVLEQFATYKSWVQFEDNFGRHINSMYLELENNDW